MSYSDQKLGIFIEKIETDTDPGGTRNSFDTATTFMVAVDPVQKRMKGGDKSAKTGRKGFLKKLKASVKGVGGIGKLSKCPLTGVEYRWHANDSYAKLTQNQRKSLKAWQDTEEGQKALAASKEKHEKATKKKRAA